MKYLMMIVMRIKVILIKKELNLKVHLLIKVQVHLNYLQILMKVIQTQTIQIQKMKENQQLRKKLFILQEIISQKEEDIN